MSDRTTDDIEGREMNQQTKDQVAAIMLLHGNPDQQRYALEKVLMDRTPPTLPPCHADIYKNGEVVAMISGANAVTIEAYVQYIARTTGEHVDWHYVGGYARVLAIGDIRKVRRALGDYALRVQLVG